MSEEPKAALNTDRELWREPFPDPPGDFYAPSIHVTQQGGIGINVGGLVYVKPLREWHALARASSPDPDWVHIENCINIRLNNQLCEMKPEHDDSITGFNEAWDIVRAVFKQHAAGKLIFPSVANAAEPSRPDPAKEALVGALKEIVEWRMPDTGQTWPDSSPMSYGSLFGINGERDYIISIAERALAEQGHKG